MRKAIVILNHYLTEEQINDLKQNHNIDEILYLPEDLKNIWNNINPYWDEKELSKNLFKIKDFLVKNINPVNDIVIIQGEFGATFEIINFLVNKLNFNEIYYATTERIVEEVKQPDGTVKTNRKFKHVKFRRYNI